ncbi:ABC transporter ATP-binding protein [Castellaniella defragrans]|uniref:Iron complex transport system ATP-binding protein n=1 Tax=Castellaniella defragrans TaxID=75697 RepID=A0A7W9TQ46_CASDE|nr:ATP-binding cassette domain-containing protein [Castellaniella defragrans]KAB0623572.1 ATP-binding cassette domain-containing protein [Castellaniella defragrans]MBB6083938.1 iron complex transport system ATP-binding protein [Castellaniella defragrans]
MNRRCAGRAGPSSPPADAAGAAAALLEARQVGFQIDGRAVLHPVSLTLSGGRMIGVIGANGSGKSTLGRILARQAEPSCGRLLVGGRPAGSIAARRFACEVAYLPQDIPAAAGMMVEELVALGRYPWLGAFRSLGAADRACVEESMAITRVSGLSRRFVDALSGGERQRVWLSMLVAQQARALVLDEPTSALDIRHQVEVLSLLRELCRSRGLGVVIILHDIYMAGRYCDEIVALRQGRVVAQGSGENVLRPEVLKAIYDVDMDVMVHGPSGDRVACLRA